MDLPYLIFSRSIYNIWTAIKAWSDKNSFNFHVIEANNLFTNVQINFFSAQDVLITRSHFIPVLHRNAYRKQNSYHPFPFLNRTVLCSYALLKNISNSTFQHGLYQCECFGYQYKYSTDFIIGSKQQQQQPTEKEKQALLIL